MSSFVISKKQYVKAAGIIAGISESARDFWLYDYEAGRNSTPDDYYNRFSECYNMNALSVQDQYGDTEPETDGDDYKDIFKEYRKKGKDIYFFGDKKKAIIELLHFFNSALYQTETEAYYFKMQLYFYRIIVALLQYCDSSYHNSESWGTLEL